MVCPRPVALHTYKAHEYRLFYRVRKVVETPVDDLVKLLGLEVPVAPIATLVEVTAASVALQWKINEPRNAAIKYVVKLNGTLGM